MIPYYCLIFIPLFIYALEKQGVLIQGIKRTYSPNHLSISIFFLFFIVLLSLRSVSCGIDLVNYVYYFNYYSNHSWNELLYLDGRYDVEVGFRFFNKLIACLTNNFQIYLSIVAILSTLPIYYLYKNGSDSYALTIILFLSIAPFSLYFSGLRQVLAMGFSYPAFIFAKKRKPVSFILCVIVAFSFHSSALVLLLLYPVYKAHITKKWLYAIVPLMIMVYIFNKPIFSFIVRFISDTRYESYGLESTGAYGMVLFFVLLSALLVLFTTDADDLLTQDDIGLRNIVLLCTLLQLFVPLNHVAMRINYYYIIFLPLAVPKLLKSSSKKYSQIAQITSYALGGFLLLRFIVNMHSGPDILQIFPYVPFWK